MTPEAPEALRVLLRVVELFDTLEVRHHVGGSYASSVHGIPRQTQDIDFVAELTEDKAVRLVDLLQGEFYVDAPAVREAVVRRDSFNIIHLASVIKVAVFVQGTDAFDRSEMERSSKTFLEPGMSIAVFLKSAEDMVLRKLCWYRDGDSASERQCLDILGIIRVQGSRLDQEYLGRWARHLGVDDLLGKALRDG